MTSNLVEDSCVPCRFRNIHIPADIWCATCQEGLCTFCRRHHVLTKSLQNHIFASSFVKCNTSKDFESISEQCKEHNKQFELFCIDHDVACCITCSIFEHRQCINIISLDDITDRVKESIATVNLEKNLNKFVSQVDEIIAKKELSKVLILHQIQTIKESLSYIEKQIIRNLEQSTNNIYNDINETKRSSDSQTSFVLETLKDKRNKILQNTRAAIYFKENLSEWKDVSGIRQLECFLRRERKELSAIADKVKLDHVELQLIKRKNYVVRFQDIGNLVQKSTKFVIGTNLSSKTAPPVCGKVGYDKMIPIKEFDNVSLRKRLDLFFPDPGACKITSSAILPDKSLIFADFSEQSRLLLYDRSYKFLRQINTPTPPRDLVVYDHFAVAVTLCTAKKIVKIELNSDKDNILQEIEVNGECTGIDTYQGQFLVAIKHNGILILSKYGFSIKMIPIACENLCCSNSNILYLNENSDILRCCDFTGDLIWERKLNIYTGDSSKFSSIALTGSQGNILVCDFYNGYVYLVSHDGKSENRILDGSGTYYAGGVHFNEAERTILLASHYKKKATVYDIV